jgi:hypothetical protein
MSFSVGETMSAIGTNIAWGANIAKDFTVQWGGYAVTALHEGISGPAVAQISNLFATSAASMGPYAGPAIAGVALGAFTLISHGLWNSGKKRVDDENNAHALAKPPEPQNAAYTIGNRIAQVAGLVLACGTGAALTATVLALAPTAVVGAYVLGGSLTAANLLL